MKNKIQQFGRALSAMVMPNIGAFIAWGLITALFIPGGWWPNESLAQLVGPMLRYLLPLLIAFAGGRNVGGYRGGVAGAVAAMGVIVGSENPMFLGAMLMGPLAGWCVARFDALVKGRVRSGFEMLVDNFSLGIIALLLCVLGYLVIGWAVDLLTAGLSAAVSFLLEHSLIPLMSLVVDPAKILFLNNAVNHGILTPFGMSQVLDGGSSICFLIESNPGPGLGMLLACWVFGKGSTRDSAPGAALIQAVGGIHEIYFPYVLARPALLLSVMAGNMAALTFFSLTGFGLVAPASPGSMISVILMSPKGQTFIGIAGMVIAAAVSFLVSWPIVRLRPDFQGESESGSPAQQTSGDGHAAVDVSGAISKIVFCCDAGMGSSALGATRFKARLMKAGHPEVLCTNSAIDAIPADASVIVCQRALYDRTLASAGGRPVVVIDNFLNDPALDALLVRVSEASAPAPAPVPTPAPALSLPLLDSRGVVLGLAAESREDAILRAGRLLASLGYVDGSYAPAMLERERTATTYMGMGLAIPHGTSEAKAAVKHSGIVVLQYPEGVDFDGEKAHLVIGIAGVGDEHLDILARIGSSLDDEELLSRLFTTGDAGDILSALQG